MHPTELIELFIVGVIVVVLIVASLALKGTWQKATRLLALLVIVAFAIFYVARPYWIDSQIEKKVGYLQLYLEERYTGETWEIKTVPHREDGYEHLNPYYIGVIFDSEPLVEYSYFVRTQDDIRQIGWESGVLEELQHYEQ